MCTHLPCRRAAATSSRASAPSFHSVVPPRNSASNSGHGTQLGVAPFCATNATLPQTARRVASIGSDRCRVASWSPTTSGATANRLLPPYGRLANHETNCLLPGYLPPNTLLSAIHAVPIG